MSQHLNTGISEPAFPEFATRWPGYDRQQVEDYIHQLRRFLADAETRAAEAYALLNHIRAAPEATPIKPPSQQ